MSTIFQEWQVANLSPEQQEECNAVCTVEGNRVTQLGGTLNDAGEAAFPSPESQLQFIDGQSAVFKQYFAQFQASIQPT